ncbi:MAG: hypothetical protein SPI52_01920, partial [Bacilli bacterium]|nr:hypothetical protein [Bacilli bacterium]
RSTKTRLRVSKSDKGNWAIKNTPKSGWPVTSLEGDAKNHALKTWIFIISKGDENHTLTRVRKDKLKRCRGK